MATLFQILQFFDGNGEPLSGGKVYWYEAGTSTPKDTWVDQAESAPATNPVILDNEGRVPSPQRGMWVRGSYKLILADSNDNIIFTLDDINVSDQIDWSGLTATIADLNSTSTETILKTGTYAVTAADRGKTILADATSGSFSISLPTSASLGNKFKITIKKTDASANTVTIDPASSETIDDRLTHVIYNYNDFVQIHCDGSNHFIVASQVRGTIETIIATDTLDLDDNTKYVNVNATSGSFDVNLPSAVTVGRGYAVTVKKIDSTSGVVTLRPVGAETIDGLAFFDLGVKNLSVTLKSDGVNWYIYAEVGGSSNQHALELEYLRGFVCNLDPTLGVAGVRFEKGEARGALDLADMRIDRQSTPSNYPSKRADAVWAQGAGQGGVASAVFPFTANTWLHCFVIAKADGTTEQGFDTSINATNLLSDASALGYIDYRRVGSVFMEFPSLELRRYEMYVLPGGQRHFIWDDLRVDSYNATFSGAAFFFIATPPNVNVYARINVGVDILGALGNYSVYISSLDQSAQSAGYPGGTNPAISTYTIPSTMAQNGTAVEVMTDRTSSIRMASNAPVAFHVVMTTIGWIE